MVPHIVFRAGPDEPYFPGPEWWDCASARLRALYPRLVQWHRYLATQRDPEASGLVTVYHPWEGTDNSPRWDHALARIKVAKPRPYTRLDTSQVTDRSQRPTDWDYDRYLWLVGQLRKYRTTTRRSTASTRS